MLWGAIVIIFAIIVFIIITVTGSLWIRAKNNATLATDIGTLVFYTLRQTRDDTH